MNLYRICLKDGPCTGISWWFNIPNENIIYRYGKFGAKRKQSCLVGLGKGVGNQFTSKGDNNTTRHLKRDVGTTKMRIFNFTTVINQLPTFLIPSIFFPQTVKMVFCVLYLISTYCEFKFIFPEINKIGNFSYVTESILKCFITNYFIHLLRIIVFQYSECKFHTLVVAR